MSLRVLIVPDKFKGTLTAQAAANAVARGWRRVRPEDKLELLPMSDGGDGFGEVLGGLFGSTRRRVRTLDAAHRSCAANWWWSAETRTAIIETSAVVGLAMLPPGRFHPSQLDTFGVGALVRAAASAGARNCLVGIGGSATNDGGFGLARALGWRFLDRDDREIESWTGLHSLVRLQAPVKRRWFDQILVAVDVQNPLLGPRGATRVYGPQKGLRAGDFPVAEGNLRRFARVVRAATGRDFAKCEGSGAAGGLGFGLAALLGARLMPGFDLFARHARLKSGLRAADLVITGEGAIDRSTLMGKGVGQVARLCGERDVPCLALAGVVHGNRAVARHFRSVRGLTELTTRVDALERASVWLGRLAARAAAEWNTG